MNSTNSLLQEIDEHFLVRIQEFFALKLDLSVAIMKDGVAIIPPCNIATFCAEYSADKTRFKTCQNWHGACEKLVINNKEIVITECPFGFTCFIFPVFIKDNYIASIIVGPYIKEPFDKTYMIKKALEHGLDEKYFMSKIQTIKIYSDEKIQKIAISLQAIANAVIMAAYANFELKKTGLDIEIPIKINSKNWLDFEQKKEIKNILTKREYDVLKLIVEGKSNVQIAKDLFVSMHTVKAHVSSILHKFAVDDRVQIAVRAIQDGFV